MKILRSSKAYTAFQEWTHDFGKSAETWNSIKLSCLFIGAPLGVAIPCNYFYLAELRKTSLVKDDEPFFENRLYYTSRIRRFFLFTSCICMLQALSRGSKSLMYFWFPVNLSFYGAADALNTCTRIRCEETKSNITLNLWNEVQRVPEIEDFISWLSKVEEVEKT